MYWSLVSATSNNAIQLFPDFPAFKMFWRYLTVGFDLLMMWEINKAMSSFIKSNSVLKLVRNSLITTLVCFGLLMLRFDPQTVSEIPAWFAVFAIGLTCLVFCPGLWLGLVCAYSRSSFARKPTEAKN